MFAIGMEQSKAERTKKARLVTRWINELSNGIEVATQVSEVTEKILTLKNAMELLGDCHDDVITKVGDDEDKLQQEEQWYHNYDVRANSIIKDASRYIHSMGAGVVDAPKHVKIKKLDLPSFESDHRN